MEFTIAIHEARQKRSIRWWTLELGPLNLYRMGRNPVKMRQRLLVDLKKDLLNTEPAVLAHLAPSTGLELQRPRLELNLKDGLTGRRYAVRDRGFSEESPPLPVPTKVSADPPPLLPYEIQ